MSVNSVLTNLALVAVLFPLVPVVLVLPLELPFVPFVWPFVPLAATGLFEFALVAKYLA
jgi:hypothetical protein